MDHIHCNTLHCVRSDAHQLPTLAFADQTFSAWINCQSSLHAAVSGRNTKPTTKIRSNSTGAYAKLNAFVFTSVLIEPLHQVFFARDDTNVDTKSRRESIAAKATYLISNVTRIRMDRASRAGPLQSRSSWPGLVSRSKSSIRRRMPSIVRVVVIQLKRTLRRYMLIMLFRAELVSVMSSCFMAVGTD